jgi:hypothetical protein
MKTKVTSRPNPGSRKRHHFRRRYTGNPSWDLESFIGAVGHAPDLARAVVADFGKDTLIWDLIGQANELEEQRRTVLRAIEKRRAQLSRKWTSNDKPKSRKRRAGGKA